MPVTSYGPHSHIVWLPLRERWERNPAQRAPRVSRARRIQARAVTRLSLIIASDNFIRSHRIAAEHTPTDDFE